MKALVVTPGEAGSVRVVDVDPPQPSRDQLLVTVLEVGICGTDHEIVAGEYGIAPPAEPHLILGHESLGRVVDGGGGFDAGQLVAAIVRRPDPVPCVNCANGEWDMCLNGDYTERGIKARHGYLAEFYAEHPDYLVAVPSTLERVGVLVEPSSIVAKGIEQIYRIQERLVWEPERVLVTGAGPIGLLAAAFLRARGLQVTVYDRASRGRKVELAEALGCDYVVASDVPLGDRITRGVDVAVEATGHSPLAFELMDVVGRNGIVCLTGVSGGNRRWEVRTDRINLEMVLENKVAFGTVNANRAHFELAVDALARVADGWPGWLDTLITRRVAFPDHAAAFERGADDIKTVIEVAA